MIWPRNSGLARGSGFSRWLVVLIIALVPLQTLGQDGRLDRSAEATLKIIERCHKGSERDCTFLKVEVAATLVVLGVVAAPEVVAAITARLSSGAMATASATSATGTAVIRGGVKFFTPKETEALCRFFGTSVEGAKAALQNFQMTQGITRDLLLRYKTIAEIAIEKGKDGLGVQALRLQLIQRALAELAMKDSGKLPALGPTLLPAATVGLDSQEGSFQGEQHDTAPKK